MVKAIKTQNSKPSPWADLSAHNTLAIPAQAKELHTAHTTQELQALIAQAQQKKLPFLVLGEGSNTVFLGDFNGAVILNRLSGIELVAEDQDTVTVKVAAGENWHGFVEYCVDQHWCGLENLALIPGTVGAAPIQNIGAYGVEVKDTINAVNVFDVNSGQHATLSNQECEFAYRESRFKKDWAGNKIITSVTVSLSKHKNLELSYPALSQNLNENSSVRDVFAEVVNIRSAKLPDPQKIPNAGSFFKNPVVGVGQYERLKQRYPDIVSFKHGEKLKLAAAWLIEQAGWKQKNIFGVMVHQQQALVVINPNRQTGAAIQQFAQAIQLDIKQRYDVVLEIEPRLIAS